MFGRVATGNRGSTEARQLDSWTRTNFAERTGALLGRLRFFGISEELAPKIALFHATFDTVFSIKRAFNGSGSLKRSPRRCDEPFVVACDPANLGEAIALDLDGRFLGRLRAQKLITRGPTSYEDIRASMRIRQIGRAHV